MNEEEKLAQIADNENNPYSASKKALESMKDARQKNWLADFADDDWIRLESAILGKNRRVLKELAKSNNEAIKLEAAIEINDEETLSHIVLGGKEPVHRNVALNNITDKQILETIIEQSTMEKEKVRTALRLGNRNTTKMLLNEIQDEELRFRMAQSVNDINVLNEISSHAEDTRIRQLADDWVYGLQPESDID